LTCARRARKVGSRGLVRGHFHSRAFGLALTVALAAVPPVVASRAGAACTSDLEARQLAAAVKASIDCDDRRLRVGPAATCKAAPAPACSGTLVEDAAALAYGPNHQAPAAADKRALRRQLGCQKQIGKAIAAFVGGRLAGLVRGLPAPTIESRTRRKLDRLASACRVTTVAEDAGGIRLPASGPACAVAIGRPGHVVNGRVLASCLGVVLRLWVDRIGPAPPSGFPPGVLPALAEIAAETIPEEQNRLNDFASGWEPGVIEMSASGGVMTYGSPFGITAVMTHDLILPAGRRFLISAWMKADPGTRGYFDVASATVGADSDLVAGESDFVPVSATFSIPPKHKGQLQMRFHGAGPGGVAVRDIAISELADYGVFVRVRLESAGAPALLRNATILRKGVPGGDPLGFYPAACAGPPAADCIDGGILEVELPGSDGGGGGDDGWSAWLPASTWLAGGLRATHGLELLDLASGSPRDASELRVQVGWAPDPSAVYFEGTRSLVGHRVGLVLPEGAPPPPFLLADTGLLVDYVNDDRARLLASPGFSPAAQPDDYLTGTIVNTIDLFDDWSAVSDTLDLFRDVGFNVRSFLADEPSAADRAHADAAGLDKAILHAESLLQPYTYSSTDLDLPLLRATADANAEEPYYASVAAGFAAHPGDLFAILGDEIGGLFLAGPQYRAAFHAYLSERGLTPADLGKPAWAAVLPLEDFDWTQIPAVRPDPAAGAAAARLYYWQLRFWNEATARAFRQVREAIEAEPTWGGAYPMSFNVGSPDAFLYLTYGLGVEFQTMAEADAVSALFGEAFLGYNDWCQAQQLGFYGDYVAGQVRPHGLPVTVYLHAHRGDQPQKVLTLAARGVRGFLAYAYGPFDLTTGDGVGGLGEPAEFWLRNVAAANDALARVEPWLAGASRALAPIAIVGAQSDPVWTDAGAATRDEIGLHRALTHAHHRADVVVEERVAAGDLVAEDRALVVLDRAHVSAAAFAALRGFVEGGGTLVLGRDLGLRDEYGQVDPSRTAWLGVSAGSESPAPAPGSAAVDWLVESGPPLSLPLGSPWRTLSAPGAQVLATYAGGEPAALEVERGAGRVVALGFDLGSAYLEPELDCDTSLSGGDGLFAEGWSSAIRAAVASLAARAGLAGTREVLASDPLVEVQRLTTAGGAPAVVALNYNNASLGDLAVTVPGRSGAVLSALTGISYTADAAGTVHLPLARGDVLVWSD
jgi:hypothetical protein